jgi:predicted transposase YdaD
MPYITSIERMGIAKGREEGREEGLERQRSLILRLLNRQLGAIGESSIAQVKTLSFDRLEALAEALFDFTSADDLTSWLD